MRPTAASPTWSRSASGMSTLSASAVWPGLSNTSRRKRPQASSSRPDEQRASAPGSAPPPRGVRNCSLQKVCTELTCASRSASGKRFQAAMWSLKKCVLMSRVRPACPTPRPGSGAAPSRPPPTPARRPGAPGRRPAPPASPSRSASPRKRKRSSSSSSTRIAASRWPGLKTSAPAPHSPSELFS